MWPNTDNNYYYYYYLTIRKNEEEKTGQHTCLSICVYQFDPNCNINRTVTTLIHCCLHFVTCNLLGRKCEPCKWYGYYNIIMCNIGKINKLNNNNKITKIRHLLSTRASKLVYRHTIAPLFDFCGFLVDGLTVANRAK